MKSSNQTFKTLYSNGTTSVCENPKEISGNKLINRPCRVDGAGNLENLKKALFEMTAKLKPGEDLTLFLSGHGTQPTPPQDPLSAGLSGFGGNITYRQMADLLEASGILKKHKIKIVSTSCFGGGAHALAEKFPGKVCAATAVSHLIEARARDDFPIYFSEGIFNKWATSPATSLSKLFQEGMSNDVTHHDIGSNAGAALTSSQSIAQKFSQSGPYDPMIYASTIYKKVKPDMKMTFLKNGEPFDTKTKSMDYEAQLSDCRKLVKYFDRKKPIFLDSYSAGFEECFNMLKGEVPGEWEEYYFTTDSDGKSYQARSLGSQNNNLWDSFAEIEECRDHYKTIEPTLINFINTGLEFAHQLSIESSCQKYDTGKIISRYVPSLNALKEKKELYKNEISRISQKLWSLQIQYPDVGQKGSMSKHPQFIQNRKKILDASLTYQEYSKHVRNVQEFNRLKSFFNKACSDLNYPEKAVAAKNALDSFFASKECEESALN